MSRANSKYRGVYERKIKGRPTGVVYIRYAHANGKEVHERSGHSKDEARDLYLLRVAAVMSGTVGSRHRPRYSVEEMSAGVFASRFGTKSLDEISSARSTAPPSPTSRKVHAL